jgi:hypothetical protein
MSHELQVGDRIKVTNYGDIVGDGDLRGIVKSVKWNMVKVKFTDGREDWIPVKRVYKC